MCVLTPQQHRSSCRGRPHYERGGSRRLGPRRALAPQARSGEPREWGTCSARGNECAKSNLPVSWCHQDRSRRRYLFWGIPQSVPPRQVGIQRGGHTQPVGAVGLVTLLARRALHAGKDLSADPHPVANLDRRDLGPNLDSLSDDFFRMSATILSPRKVGAPTMTGNDGPVLVSPSTSHGVQV